MAKVLIVTGDAAEDLERDDMADAVGGVMDDLGIVFSGDLVGVHGGFLFWLGVPPSGGSAAGQRLKPPEGGTPNRDSKLRAYFR